MVTHIRTHKALAQQVIPPDCLTPGWCCEGSPSAGVVILASILIWTDEGFVIRAGGQPSAT